MELSGSDKPLRGRDCRAWDLNKDPNLSSRLNSVLYNQVEAVRLASLLVLPFMPETAEGMWRRLGFEDSIYEHHLPDAARWGVFPPGQKVFKGDPLFPRIEKAG